MREKIHKKLLKFWLNIRDGLISLVKEPAFYIYLISLVIYLPLFFPNLSDIGAWDETYYIVNGKEIFSGVWPYLADGPLINFFAGFIYLFFRGSPFWLIHVNSLLRFVLFSFMCGSPLRCFIRGTQSGLDCRTINRFAC